MLPPDGQPPKFIELYVYDTSNEVNNRLRALDPSDALGANLDSSFIEALTHILDQCNPLAVKFRTARYRFQEDVDEEFIIRIVGAREGDPVQYNLPTIDQLAMLVVGDFTLETFQCDIVKQARSGEFKQISTLHPAFMVLQYHLLFPYGE